MTLDTLLACAGRWRGPSILEDPERGIAEETASELTVTPVLQNRFLRIDYAWTYRGKPQEGMMLAGCDPATSECTLYWADTWHMGHEVMTCRGTARGSTLSVRGSYAASPGPDWGWRIEVEGAAAALRVLMFNVTPEGEEVLAVKAEYAPLTR